MGNLVWWELARLARRGHAARARILLLYALLLGIIVFAFLEPGSPVLLFKGQATLDLRSAGRFSRQLVFVLLEAQLLLVVLITPAYAVSAIAEEKDRQTLPLLLTTPLSDREMVWGKAIARVLFVMAAVVCGIPVMMLTQLFGGVHLELIATGYVLTFTTVVFATAVGIAAACYCSDTRNALSLAYVVIVLGVFLQVFNSFLLLPIIADSSAIWRDGGVLVAVQLGISCGLLLDASRRLRKPGETAGPLPTTEFPEPPRGRAMPMLLEWREPHIHRMRALGRGDPILWKERHAKTHPSRWGGFAIAMTLLVAGSLFFFGGWLLVSRTMQALDPDKAVQFVRTSNGSPDYAVQFVRTSNGSPDYAGALLMLAGTMAGGLYVLPLAVGVTDSIAGERLRGTLDSLLVSLLDRRQLLWAKVRAHAEHGLGFAVWAASSLGAGFGTEGGISLGFAMMAVFASGCVFIVGLGSWLSVRCSTPLKAFRLCLPALLTVGACPLLAWGFTNWENNTRTTTALVACAVSFVLAGGLFAWRAGAELDAST
ncbi:MAG: ABC transporter permease subunit [Gemmataceae bacterium]